MDQTRSTTLGALVLIGGAAAAMMFRKADESPPVEASPANGKFAIAVADAQQNSDVVLRDHSEGAVLRPPSSSSQGPAATLTANDPPPAFDAPTQAAPLAPSMPSRYGGLLSSNASQSTAANAAPAMTPRRRVAQTQEHPISDLETLESIAQRYYGDPSLAEALFRANQDRLASQRILPLDVVLRIPPLDQLRAANGEAAASNAPTPQARTTLGSVR